MRFDEPLDDEDIKQERWEKATAERIAALAEPDVYLLRLTHRVTRWSEANGESPLDDWYTRVSAALANHTAQPWDCNKKTKRGLRAVVDALDLPDDGMCPVCSKEQGHAYERYCLAGWTCPPFTEPTYARPVRTSGIVVILRESNVPASDEAEVA